MTDGMGCSAPQPAEQESCETCARSDCYWKNHHEPSNGTDCRFFIKDEVSVGMVYAYEAGQKAAEQRIEGVIAKLKRLADNCEETDLDYRVLEGKAYLHAISLLRGDGEP